MQRFTIRDIENLTGIKAHTLRIWEQRYRFFTPKRKESKHRYYDNDDLKKLLQISYLYHSGWKVSRIAGLPAESITREVAEAEVTDGNAAPHVMRMIAATVDFNESRFLEVFRDVCSKIGFERCIIEVCYPYLKKVGHLWTTNNVIPAQEHFSSYMIQNQIIVATEQLGKSPEPPDILLICPQGEFHELPLLFINYLMRKNGWSTLYLGTNIKKPELKTVLAAASLHTVYLHLITNFTGLSPSDYLEDICLSFPDKRIIASGEGIRHVQRQLTNLVLLKSDAAIYSFIRRTTS